MGALIVLALFFMIPFVLWSAFDLLFGKNTDEHGVKNLKDNVRTGSILIVVLIAAFFFFEVLPRLLASSR